MDWNNFWLAVWDFCVNSGEKLLTALLVFLVGFVIIKIVKRIVSLSFSKSNMQKTTQSFILSTLNFALNLILIIAILGSLGIQTTGLIALLSAAGLAISLSLQNSLSNLANGIVIISTQPFEVGDYVSINGSEGTIKSIQMLTTTLITSDNKEIILPNSTIVNNAIINYNKLKTRKSVLNFQIAYEADIKQVRQIILDCIRSDGRTLTDPAPSVVVKELGNDYITLTAYFWEDSEDYYSVNNYVREAVVNEFKRNDIPRNYENYEVHIIQEPQAVIFDETPLQQRTEKIRPNKIEHSFINTLHNKIEKRKKAQKQKKIEKSQKNNKK